MSGCGLEEARLRSEGKEVGIEQDKEKKGEAVKGRRSELCEMDEYLCGALDSGNGPGINNVKPEPDGQQPCNKITDLCVCV